VEPAPCVIVPAIAALFIVALADAARRPAPVTDTAPA
jgi:hypothetical protein